jgi:hypothetical protein
MLSLELSLPRTLSFGVGLLVLLFLPQLFLPILFLLNQLFVLESDYLRPILNNLRLEPKGYDGNGSVISPESVDDSGKIRLTGINRAALPVLRSGERSFNRFTLDLGCRFEGSKQYLPLIVNQRSMSRFLLRSGQTDRG